MTYVVCRNKDDGSLFITTRAARETMLSVILDLGQIPDSNVLKEYQTYDEAVKFKKEQELVDKQLNEFL